MLTQLSQIWPALSRIAGDHAVAHLGAADLRSDGAAVFADWMAAGHHGGMSYLEKSAAIRRNPQERFPWAKSIIAILVPYSAQRPEAPHEALSNHVARYALGDDYHDVLDRILRMFESEIQRRASADAESSSHPVVKTWRYVDTGPLSDRAAAVQAGLGWIGRNGMLINEDHGSYFFIGTLLTSLENNITPAAVADRCGSCTRCIEACPTDAILPGRLVAAERCISYATIEHRGPLPDLFSEHLAGNAFGCDICQEVCPWNRGEPPEPHPAFEPRPSYRSTPVTDLLKMRQADFSTFFTRSAIKRAKLDGMKRNVLAIVSEGESEKR